MYVEETLIIIEKDEKELLLNRIQTIEERESEALNQDNSKTFSPTKTKIINGHSDEHISDYDMLADGLLKRYGDSDPDTKLDKLYNKLKLKNNQL